MSLEENTFKMD